MAKKKAAPKKTTSTTASKKTQPATRDSNLPIASLADLIGDADNPRKISEDGAEGLGFSLDRFGDLAGITFNRRTGQLVTGHQRVEQIRERWPEAVIEVIDAERGAIRVDVDHYFNVRVVDWSQAKQRAANAAANNPQIQGTFTKNLSDYLLSVEAQLKEELPTVLDECLLVDLMATGMDLSDATEQKNITAIEMGEHEQVAADISTIKFAFASPEDRESVEHAIEACKSSNSFEEPGVDGKALAHVCRDFLAKLQQTQVNA